MSTPNGGGNGVPALGPELTKAEARQASNLRVTTKAIDALYARIAKAKRELDRQQQQQQQQESPSPVGTPSRGGVGAKSPVRSPTTRSPSKGKGAAAGSKSPHKSASSRKSPSKSSASAAAGETGPQAMDLEDGGGGGSGVVGVLSGLASDVAGLKTLEAVGSENKNFHATISKLAKAAEKVRLLRSSYEGVV